MLQCVGINSLLAELYARACQFTLPPCQSIRCIHSVNDRPVCWLGGQCRRFSTWQTQLTSTGWRDRLVAKVPLSALVSLLHSYRRPCSLLPTAFNFLGWLVRIFLPRLPIRIPTSGPGICYARSANNPSGFVWPSWITAAKAPSCDEAGGRWSCSYIRLFWCEGCEEKRLKSMQEIQD